MELRHATADDWQAARAVRLQSLTQDLNSFCATLEQASSVDEQTWRERLERGYTVLAWDGEVPVATIAGKDDPHEPGGREIVALWVDPAQRATGLADALISSVLDWARVEGAHEVALWVAEDNVSARALYERTGFTVTGEREAMRPGVDQIRMRREIARSSE
ncbi:MAG: GNAT family N-acetyltransferase [Terrimesophilobacter sp.]